MIILSWGWSQKSGDAISSFLSSFPMALCVSFLLKALSVSRRYMPHTGTCILAWHDSVAKTQTIAMAQPNLSDMRAPKCTIHVWWGTCIYCSRILLSDHDIVAISGQWPNIARFQDSEHDYWLVYCNMCMVKLCIAVFNWVPQNQNQTN